MKEEYSLKKYLATFFRLWPIPEDGYSLTPKAFRGTMSHAYEYGGGKDFEAVWETMSTKPEGNVRVKMTEKQMKKMLTQFYNAS